MAPKGKESAKNKGKAQDQAKQDKKQEQANMLGQLKNAKRKLNSGVGTVDENEKQMLQNKTKFLEDYNNLPLFDPRKGRDAGFMAFRQVPQDMGRSQVQPHQQQLGES